MSSISPTVAFNKDAFPTRRHSQPAGPNHSPAKTSPKGPQSSACLSKPCVTASRDCFLHKSSSAISGFRSLCGREQHSSQLLRSIGPAFWNLSLGGLSLRELWPPPVITYGAGNPGPMLWPERSRSRGIFQGVFLRSNRTLSGHFAARDGPLDARQIGFGRRLQALTLPPPSSPRSRRFGPVRPPRPERRPAPEARRLRDQRAIGIKPVGAAVERRAAGRGHGPRRRVLRFPPSGYRAGSTRSDRTCRTAPPRSRRR